MLGLPPPPPPPEVSKYARITSHYTPAYFINLVSRVSTDSYDNKSIICFTDLYNKYNVTQQ